jgi:hypothetical protein
MIDDDGNTRLRLSAQRALLTHITPSMRAVSVEAVPERQLAWVRFTFDAEPGPSELGTAAVAHTEILADFEDEWTVELEIARTPAPLPMEHRRILVFHRCEDEWVTGGGIARKVQNRS